MASKILIDVSEHQGVLNWDAIEAAYRGGQILGVIMRAGYGTATGMQKDGQFDRNRNDARQRGIPRQFYGFAYPGRSSGAVQGAGMAAIIGQLEAGESVSLDMEDEPTYGRRLVASDVSWALEFCNTLKAALGPKPLVYMNSDVLGRFDWTPLVKADYGLWLANYGPNNGQQNGDGPSAGQWPFWAIWQYTSRGNVAGIFPVDTNLFSGADEAAFLKYGLQGAAPAPTPAPAPSPAPVGGNNTTYVLNRDLPGYVTAADAAAGRNSNSTAKAGSYFVFNQYAGMVNITKTPNVPGYWINPSANTASAPSAPAPSGNYSVGKPIPGYVNAGDAAGRRNSNSTVPAGNYFVFNTYQGMVNITRIAGSPGWWINPGDNGSAPSPAPAAAYIKVPSGPDGYLGTIARQYGTTVDQLLAWNKSKYPSMTRDYVQAGWEIRVR